MAAANSNQLAAEMARFEQELLGMTGAAPSGPTPLFATTSALPKPTPLFPKHGSTKSSNPVPLLPNPVPYQAPAPSAPSTSSSSGSKKKSKSAIDPEAQRNALEKAAEAVALSEGHLKQKRVSMRKSKKDPTKLRLAGGQVWEDPTLTEWDPNDYRIFCGDLGNDVNDDTLAKAFSKYPTFLKAKVIRDKFSKKTKGFGFVSFRDAHDFMQAMREMNGKYVGSRPIRLTKSTWKDRNYLEVKKKDREKKKLGLR